MQALMPVGNQVEQQAKLYLADPKQATVTTLLKVFEQVAGNAEWCKNNSQAARVLMRAVSYCYLRGDQAVKERIKPIVLNNIATISPYVSPDLKLQQVAVPSLLLCCRSDYFNREFASQFQEKSRLLGAYPKKSDDTLADYSLEPFTPEVVNNLVQLFGKAPVNLKGKTAIHLSQVHAAADMTLTKEFVDATLLPELQARWTTFPIPVAEQEPLYKLLSLCPSDETKDTFILNLVRSLSVDEVLDGIENERKFKRLPFLSPIEVRQYGFEFLVSQLGDWFARINHRVDLVESKEKLPKEASREEQEALRLLRRFKAVADKNLIYVLRGSHFAKLNPQETVWLFKFISSYATELNLAGTALTNDAVFKDFERDSLKKLSFAGSQTLQSLSRVENIRSLKHLDVSNCPNLCSLMALRYHKLEYLNVKNCDPDLINHEAKKMDVKTLVT